MSTLADTNSSPVRLAERAVGRSPYAPPTPEFRIDLHLDANEGSPAPEAVIGPAGGKFERAIVQDAGGVVQMQLSIGKGAAAALYVLNSGGDYGRVELDVTLHEGADFTLGCAQIGGAKQTLEIITTVTHSQPGATSRQTVRSVAGGTASVKCAHGCAIGELDAMALYYLQSRGIAPAEAKTLLLQAFVAGVFDGAADAERLQELALAKLGELV